MTQVATYTLEEPLGFGSFGTAWMARDPMGAEWVVKTVPNGDAVMLAELRHEFRALWDLDLPGILCPHELGADNGVAYLVMERAPGRPLGTLPTPVDPEVVDSVHRQLVTTLSGMHARGLLHLDLSPENVHIDDEGTVTLLDFGLARWRTGGPGRLGLDDHIGGTHGFMAPEVSRGGAPTPGADWYGLGALLYALEHGSPPLRPQLGQRQVTGRPALDLLLSLDPDARGPGWPVREQEPLVELESPGSGTVLLLEAPSHVTTTGGGLVSCRAHHGENLPYGCLSDLLGSTVLLAPPPTEAMASDLADVLAGRGLVVEGADFADGDTLTVLEEMARRGCPLILLTQGGASPARRLAERLDHRRTARVRFEVSKAPVASPRSIITDDIRPVVEVLVACGGPVPATFVSQAMVALGRSPLTVAQAIRRGVIAPIAGARLAMEHTEGIGPVPAGLHAVLLRVAAGQPELAWPHARALGQTELAGRLAESAAEQAEARGVFGAAFTWYGRALEHGRPVEKALLRSAVSAGRVREALALSERLAGDRSRVLRAELLLASGATREGLAVLEQEVEVGIDAGPVRKIGGVVLGLTSLLLFGPATPRVHTDRDPEARVLWAAARGLAYTQPLWSLWLGFRAMRRAARAGDGAVASSVLAFLGGGLFLQLGPLRRRAVELLDLAESSATDPTSRSSVAMWRAAVKIQEGRWDDARPLLADAIDVLRTAPTAHWERLTALQFDLWLDWWQGDFNRLFRRADLALGDAIESGDTLGRAIFVQYRAYALLAFGELDTVEADCRWLDEVWSEGGFNAQTYYSGLIASMARSIGGDVPAARATWERVQPGFRRSGGDRIALSRIDNRLMDARLARLEGATERLPLLAREIRATGRADSAALAAWVEGVEPWGDVAADLRRAGLFGAAAAIEAQLGDTCADAWLRSRGCARPDAWASALWPIGSTPR
ncbi:MAG: serine/threonine protein kinase [Alphaproteobacteria bacterium]|nr:serine/threonine protein kinase [Alphaproteobacteria bacterium]